MNPNNFNALSYKIKALIALGKDLEAYGLIKQALSIKYSKTLAGYLKEIEEKYNMNKHNKSDISIELEETSNLIVKNNDDKKKVGIFDSTLMKLIKLIFYAVTNFFKKNKTLLALLILLLLFYTRNKWKIKIQQFVNMIRF
jgi:hypothetical protein